MGKAPPSKTTSAVQKEFLPAYLEMFRSAFGAANRAAGNPDSTAPYYSTGYNEKKGMPAAPPVSGGPAAGGAYGGGGYNYNGPVQNAGYGAPVPLGGGGGGGGGGDPSGGVTGIKGTYYGTGPTGAPIIGQPFEGPFNAPANPLEYEALARRESIARSLGGIDLPIMQLGLDQASGKYLHPGSNPYLMANIDAATRPVYEAFDKARAGMASNAIQSGAYKGSSRRDLADQELSRDFQRNVGDITSRLVFDNYQRERQYQQSSPEMIDAAVRMAQVAPEMLGSTGLGYRNLEQLGIEEKMRAFEEGIAAPFRPLLPLASLIQGQPVGNVSIARTPTQPASGAGIISGALGGASLGAGAANATGYGDYQNIAALLGALGGGAAGYI